MGTGAYIIIVIALIIVLILIIVFLNRFYKKSTRDTALIRTGFGGQKITLSGGCISLPFLHKTEEVNMRVSKIDIKRFADKSIITTDRIRVDVELDFYIRVSPNVEGVARASQSFGVRALGSTEYLKGLLEGRFIDAIQAISAEETMDSLHEKRGDFVKKISNYITSNLEDNGLLLDSVSLIKLDQAAFSSLDENNAFNALGMRKLAEIISVNKKKRSEIEAETEVSVKKTYLLATKEKLALDQDEEQAQISQKVEIEKFKSTSESEAIIAAENANILNERAKINRELEIKSQEVNKLRELNKLEVEARLASEIRRIDSSIAVSRKLIEESKTKADAELSKTEVILAQESVQTEKERAIARRSHEISIARSKEKSEVQEIDTQIEIQTLLEKAKAESNAIKIKADAEREKLLAESEGKKALIAAQNTQSNEVIEMELEKYRLEKLPSIVEQMIKPVEKIDSIKINHISGLSGSNNSSGGSGESKPPVNQVLDSILEMALQLPAMKSIGGAIGEDLLGAVPKRVTKDSDKES